MTQNTYTIEQIEQKKRELGRKIEKKKDEISDTYASLVEEEEFGSRSERLFSNATRLFTIADSMWMGYKLYRKFSPYLTKRKKRARK